MSDFTLRVSDDDMAVYLDCQLTDTDTEQLVDAILDQLMLMKIAHPPTKELLHGEIQAMKESGTPLINRVISEGRPAVPSKDGRIEWAEDFFSDEFVVDEESGSMNFRLRKAKVNVTENQQLARAIPPVAGIEGYDVYGTKLTTRQPTIVPISLGPGVRHDPSDNTFFATETGRISWVNDKLTVDQVYEIDGDIGLSSGDIDHTGAVLVHGDILDGSTVQAKGDVEVARSIEASSLTVGGNLTVHGGITGSPNTKIIVKGNLRAKYLMNADVEVHGDVIVANEIVNSTVQTLGKVVVERGRLVGGTMVALLGAEVAVIGSKFGVPTEIVAGEDYNHSQQRIQQRCELLELRDRSKKLHQTIDSLEPKLDTLPPSQKSALEKLVEICQATDESIKQLESKIASFQKNSTRESIREVSVSRALHADTRICLGAKSYSVNKEHKGPVRAIVQDDNVALVVPS